jgi:Asp-tRNA(Asn)/Glu-tRNA(Gln) amidotransferase A subunit family amidase
MAAKLDLCFMTGSEALSAFKSKKLSPVELMKAVIARCEEINPKLNAITYGFYDRALARAKEAETHYVKSPGDIRPLEGLPVAIKDFHPV